MDRKNRVMTGSRARIERRAQALLAAAAASATIAGCHDGASSTGYGVVDPMPPPARCPGLAAVLKIEVTWKQQDGKFVIHGVLTPPADRPDVKLQPTGQLYAYGGKVLSFQGGQALSFDVAPDPGAPTVSLPIDATCTEGPQQLYLTLTLLEAGAPAAGQSVPAKLE